MSLRIGGLQVVNHLTRQKRLQQRLVLAAVCMWGGGWGQVGKWAVNRGL